MNKKRKHFFYKIFCKIQ